MAACCSVCALEESKYKCPLCRLPYCSVTCCKHHKEVCLSVPTQEKVPAGSFTKLSSPVDDGPGLAEEEDTVDTSSLEGLKTSEELRAMLCNKHLRKLLLELEKAGPKPNSKEQTLDRLMQFPIFEEFADACLRVCGLRENTPTA